MSRHAKNNTASAVFTYYERSKLKYGTQKQRLGKDSLKQFDACSLCLQSVTDPMCCPKGHIYCKECIYENILSQKKEIKKSKKQFEEHQRELQEKEEQKKQQQKEAEIEAFGKSELGILPETHQVFRSRSEDGETVSTTSSASSSSTALVVVDPSKPKATPAIVSGQADPAKGEKLQLNSYWVPSLTPSAAQTQVKPPKTEIVCHEGNHPIKLKQLIKVKFTAVKQAEKSDARDNYCCPICRRTLTDAYKSALLKTCGHVLCQGCIDKFKHDKICTVCDTPFRTDHVIPLQAGGTGFSGHDARIMAKKEDVSAWV